MDTKMNEKALMLDLSLCVGCGACVAACMDQNDILPEKGEPAFRRIYQLEEGAWPDAAIQYVSAGCMHCEDSPCLVGCPTGAISKDVATGSIVVNADLCIGCHSCALACPFGVPRYDAEDKMHKCDRCAGRVAEGLKPACVRVCAYEALKFEDPNALQQSKELQQVESLSRAVRRTVL